MTNPTHPPAHDVNTEPVKALMRMVDFRIPLTWLIGGFIVFLWAAISMYFQLQRVSESLVAVQIELKAGNTAYAALAGEVTLLKFRMDGMETDRRSQFGPPQQPTRR